ncbi:MAG: GNAT family N-acetyltransferase [Alphaproteobacteria bacterium]|nr:GNAT family N-acetyltransferase [Alphaproteobacteria bacterium]
MEINIRDAEINDLMSVFELSNDVLARKNSINQAQIKLEDHKKWFMEKISSKFHRFFIIENQNNELVAYVRYDKSDNDWTISINIKNDFRGKGLSSKIIKETSEKLKGNIFALIKKNNIPSYKCFKKADYKIVEDVIINDEDYYKMKFSS